LAFVFLFDYQYRLIERQLWETYPWNNSRREHERLELGDYTAYTDDSGETIWFPGKAVTRRFASLTMPDGQPIEYKTETMTLMNVRSNAEIPDENFVIPLPPEGRVYDRLTGQGDLPPSSEAALALWTDPPRPAKRWLWWVAAAVALIGLTLVGVVV